MFDLWDILKNVVGFFFDALRGLAAGLVGRIMLTLGIGLATYTAVLPELVSFLQTYLNSMSPSMVELLGALKVDVALTMLFSALGVKLGTRVQAIRIGGTDRAA